MFFNIIGDSLNLLFRESFLIKHFKDNTILPNYIKGGIVLL